ncbi:hypothetical protein MLD38_004264 [Melastoma candidum]|uniref:Uncharacterized protein n=1 Tax=Melastoma candidum TaxID=119954 RepID=A0ACB9S4V7_9MYRT|nr:hypothetical protein MLD38_004264 [Melastoma candidum]
MTRMYERVGMEEDEKSASMDLNGRALGIVGKWGGGQCDRDEDVEMAVKSLSPRSRVVPSCGGGGAGKGDSGAVLDSPEGKSGLRLASLDVFRGISVVLMIFVDNAGRVFPAVNHSPWNGLTLADFVMPFFLFIVGVSLALAYKKMPSKNVATRKMLLRALKLIALGVFLQGGYFHGVGKLTYGVDIQHMRVLGILQRIAIAYLISALCEIWLKRDGDVSSGYDLLQKYQYHWILVMLLTTAYIALTYGLFVPDWHYQLPSQSERIVVKCGVRGDMGPACNAAGLIDRTILGIPHLYGKPVYRRTKQCSINSPDYGPLLPNAPSWCQAPFDPEGLLSSVMAIITCLVGMHFGHVIVHFKDHGDRIYHWMASSSCLVVIGFIFELFGMEVNKVLYTCSYMCITGGVAGILFIGLYLLVDYSRHRGTTIVLELIGKHALLIFILAATNVVPVMLQGFYWKRPENNILGIFGIRRS